MSKMEWYYSSQPSTPTLFEGDANGPSQPLPKPQPFDLFAPFHHVESIPAQPAEPEYYGASDTEMETVTPEAAFLKFASHVYAPSEIASVERYSRETKSSKPERRKARIERIAAEIEELEKDEGSEGSGDDAYDLRELRRQLVALEKARKDRELAAARRPLIEERRGDKGDDAGGKQVTLELVSPDLASVVSLERRVAELERMVGVTNVQGCAGMVVASVMEDVKRRLDILEDDGIGDRLKKEARDVAEVLRREVQSDAGVGALQTAEILKKMERWEELAETVPVVIERLRCLKSIHDEAGGMVDALHRVERTLAELKERRVRNEELIANVDRNLKENMKTVEQNLDILESRLGMQQ
eukprot:GFKZ01004376.1.p1 GENE.GFKZ01004376.1~~GFKZ01004376.1.p1  ORF type:complete len:386 (+),score=84.63 GFKZ01004376.1:89-1159(+)